MDTEKLISQQEIYLKLLKANSNVFEVASVISDYILSDSY